MVKAWRYTDGMSNSANTYSTVHVHDMKNFKVKFTPVNSGGVYVAIYFGYTANLTIFFNTEQDAKEFASQMWLSWTDHDFRFVEGVAGA